MIFKNAMLSALSILYLGSCSPTKTAEGLGQGSKVAAFPDACGGACYK